MRIVNVVATAVLECSLDLPALQVVLADVHAQYTPSRFPAVCVRVHGSHAMLLANGKLVIAGARSVAAAKRAARESMRRVHPTGQMHAFQVRNMVGECVSPPRAERLRHRFPDSSALATIHTSGRTLIMGVASHAEMKAVWQCVQDM